MRAVREVDEPARPITLSAIHDELPCPTTWSDYTSLPEHHKAKWRVAINNELTSLKTINTLKPVLIQFARQHTPRIIQTRWLLKLKPAVPPSTTPTPKARLVARGFQEPGINDRDDVTAWCVVPKMQGRACAAGDQDDAHLARNVRTCDRPARSRLETSRRSRCTPSAVTSSCWTVHVALGAV
jgi:hypothetical protein